MSWNWNAACKTPVLLAGKSGYSHGKFPLPLFYKHIPSNCLSVPKDLASFLCHPFAHVLINILVDQLSMTDMCTLVLQCRVTAQTVSQSWQWSQNQSTSHEREPELTLDLECNTSGADGLLLLHICVQTSYKFIFVICNFSIFQQVLPQLLMRSHLHVFVKWHVLLNRFYETLWQLGQGTYCSTVIGVLYVCFGVCIMCIWAKCLK